MSAITVLTIPADVQQPMVHVTIDNGDLRAMQALVGGSIQPMYLPDSAHELIVNEEGKIVAEPTFNVRATDLARQFGGLYHPLRDYVAGDAFLVGPVDPEGNMTGIAPDSPTVRFCERMA